MLSKPPTERVLYQHSNMDHIARDLHDVLLRAYPIPQSQLYEDPS